jgi:K+-sensing histidine kinase KdpD
MSATEPVTFIRSEDLLAEPVRAPRAPARGLGTRRRVAGLALAAFALPLLTLLLDGLRDTLSLESQVLLYLLLVVLVAVVGGLAVALASAIAASFALNYFFIKPLHTLDISQGEQALALLIFVLVAAAVSGAVELAARRARVAERAAREARTFAELAAVDLDESEALKAVLAQARSTFEMESVALKARDHPSGEWIDVEEAGWAPRGQEAPLRFDVPIGTELRLVGRGPALFAEDQRVLQTFASAAQTAYEGRRLSARVRQAQTLESADRQRTALLAAVGHDLRTPLAGIKASVGTLRQSDVEWSPAEREELLATIEESADRLQAIVTNLLDASRLQAGALSVRAEPVALDEVIGASVLAVPGARERVTVDVPEDLPLVRADPGLLERVLANLLDNALRHAPDASPVEIRAVAGESSARVVVVDHGPGVPADRLEAMFRPFQRLDDREARGVGLGLAVARGFVEAMGGVLIADGSAGEGLTMRLRLPLAE